MKILRAFVAAGMAAWLSSCAPYLEHPQDVQNLRHLNQGWGEDERQAFYYRPQGTVFMPLAWFKALEEWNENTLLSDTANLNRYGFLTDGVHKNQWNPEGLPVGLSTMKMDLQANGQFQDVVGVGCAACHTGQINVNGTGIRVDGGASLTNFSTFQMRVAMSLVSTWYLPWKWDRFVDRVLGHDASKAARDALTDEYKTLAFTPALAAITDGITMGLYPVDEGYGRLDALQRIANTLLGDDLNNPANYRKVDAPVHLPPIWDIQKFDWVQYNGSVRQPMIRNVGEALGVRAQTYFLNGDKSLLFASTIPVHDLMKSEEAIRRLKAPRWQDAADVLGPIDPARRAQGRELYKDMCASCHAPRQYTITFQGEKVTRWQLPLVENTRLGTDTASNMGFITRTYDAKALGQPDPITAGAGLYIVTEAIKDYQYKNGNRMIQPRVPPWEKPTPVPGAAEQAALDGYGLPNQVRAPCAYKARPLFGLWASPPFLHNGSVPTLYDLLSPERPASFTLGNRDYDPVKVGYKTTPLPGSTVINTAKAGNLNTGHLFKGSYKAGEPLPPGVLGRGLSEDERMALVEYLKSMNEDDADAIILDGKYDEAAWEFPCNNFWRKTASAQ